jgi:endogenous inhibitor of DNA gyrase (YacG/DUF329 family)
MAPKVVPCPHCGTAVEWSPASRWRPFCSERCKTIDFGAWASESYRIQGEEPTQLDGGERTPATERRERRDK